MDVPSTPAVNYKTDKAFTVSQVPTPSLRVASSAASNQDPSVCRNRSRHVGECRLHGRLRTG
eukprot:4833153-Pleurochrysis_carterae.AAC.2